MRKLKKIPFIVSIVLVFTLLVSVFSLTCFAHRDPSFENDDIDPIYIDESYYHFETSLVLSSWSNYVNDEAIFFDFTFYPAFDSSIEFQRISMVYWHGVMTCDFHFTTDPSSDRVTVWTWDGSEFDVLRSDLLHILVPSGNIPREALVFLNMFCVPGVHPGLYRFNPSSSYLGSENFIIPFFMQNDPDRPQLPSYIRGYKNDHGSFVDFRIEEFYYEYVGNSNVSYEFYSLRFGYANNAPSSLNEGRIHLQYPAFFSSYEQYNAFVSLFYLEGSDSDPNYDYSDGYADGFDEGYSTGYFVGEAEGTIKGFEEGVTVGRENGYSEGYDDGYSDGENASGSASLGKNLLGETLSAPFNAFMNIKLFDLPNGNPFTLGTVFSTLVSLVIFIIFLKMFAGG